MIRRRPSPRANRANRPTHFPLRRNADWSSSAPAPRRYEIIERLVVGQVKTPRRPPGEAGAVEYLEPGVPQQGAKLVRRQEFVPVMGSLGYPARPFADHDHHQP